MDDEHDDQDIRPVRNVLADNVARLMKARLNLDSNPKLSAKTGIAVSTISRVVNGKSAATIDMVDRLAEAFGVQPWQMLVPELDPTNPQILRNSSPHEERLYQRLRQVIEEENAVKAGGSDSSFGQFER